MIPAAFEYRRARSVADAVDLLDAAGGDATVLAGGHSLLPLMKLRRARPALVVDIGGCREELAAVRREGPQLVLGALVTFHELATSEVVAEQVPVLADAAGRLGDPQVRHRGTLGGSLAFADPAGDLPGVVLALGGTVVARGRAGDRHIPVEAFFTGHRRTALEPGELVVQVQVPAVPGAGWAYQRFTSRAGGWPVVAVAAVAHPGCGVAMVNMGPTPVRAAAVEAAWAAGASPDEAAPLAVEGTLPAADLAASAGYRRHLAAVLTRRALAAAGRRP